MTGIGMLPLLALFLFAPWFLILSALYWLYPRQPRPSARRLFDGSALVLAFVACAISLHWSYDSADQAYGALWPQMFATTVGYGVFLMVLGAAYWLRRRWLLAR